jgi:hypothetical protein
MLNKVFAGLVIAFWAAMMTVLVRIEIFPEPVAVEVFPTDRVLQKVFSNPEPVRLKVLCNGSEIGTCGIRITPPQLTDKRAEELTSRPEVEFYKVTSDLKLQLSTFGTSSRLWLTGESWFTKKLELGSFEFLTQIGEGHRGGGHFGDGYIYVNGDDRTKKVKVKFGFGDWSDVRSFSFDQIKGAGFANALGLPGMANFNFLGGAGLPRAFAASSNGGVRTQPETTTYVDHLQIAGNSERVYLMYSKIDDQTWTKMWVDDSGQVLQVITSLGLEMRTGDVSLGMDESVDRVVSQPRWR